MRRREEDCARVSWRLITIPERANNDDHRPLFNRLEGVFVFSLSLNFCPEGGERLARTPFNGLSLSGRGTKSIFVWMAERVT